MIINRQNLTILQKKYNDFIHVYCTYSFHVKIPSVEMNFLQSLNRSGTQEPEEVGENIWGDITQQGRDLNWTVAIGVGANYRITPKFTAFVRPHFKYQLQPLLKTSGEYSGNSNEILMWIGGQTGIRFYF